MPHKLLLADDSVTIQRVIELTFADEDVHVLAVGDGKKAIESIQSDRPDIVLADVGMPERDGYEVAEFIKRNSQLADIPVLLLTGAFEPIDETRARAVGCDGVLVKPFEPQMVINRVKDLLAGRRSGGLWGGKPASPAPEQAPTSAERSVTPQPARAAAPTSPSLEEYFDRLDAAFASVEAASEARSPVPPMAPASPATSSAVSPPSSLSTDDSSGWDPDPVGGGERVQRAAPQAMPFIPAEPSAAPRSVDALPRVSGPISAPGKESLPGTPAPPVMDPHSAHPVSPAASTHIARPATDSKEAPAAPTASPTPGIPFPSLAEAFAALLSAEQGRRVSPSAVGPSPAVSDETIDEIVRRVIGRMSDTVVRESVLDVAERLVREEIERIKGAH